MHPRSLLALLAVPILTGCVAHLHHVPGPAVAHWSFDGQTLDGSGHGNNAHGKVACFTDGHVGQAVQIAKEPLSASDCADLRLAPGFVLDCWVKLDDLPRGYDSLITKKNEYLLRVDPVSEGSRFSFFIYQDGWEPRVQSRRPAKIGEWVHLIAGWDGKETFLAVNGELTRRERPGTVAPTYEPLAIGSPHAVIDELRVENPAARGGATASWSFDGTLCDISGNGHDIAAPEARFAPGLAGQALCSENESLVIPSAPDLQLAPGLRLDCRVYFEKEPTDIPIILMKEGEYMLRVNPQSEGGQFAFFTHLDRWEPRVSGTQRVKAGQWYRVIALWDGTSINLDVNGEQTRVARSGLAKPTDNPLQVGVMNGLIDDLTIENPHLPMLRVQDMEHGHAVLRAGETETLAATLGNVGSPAQDCTAELVLPPDVTCLGPTSHALGTVGTGDTRELQWTVRCERETTVNATIRIAAANCRPVKVGRILPFFAPNLEPTLPEPAESAFGMGTTYYVDALQGDNSAKGISPERAWFDFTNVNGRTLGPGDRLLIRRGSVINQELRLSARGTETEWAEIAAYGEGARPTIRRNWDIDDRCALIENSCFLRIRNLVVCYAGKGLMVHQRQPGSRGLIIEDCIAHHIEGLYRPNSHGIPEWRGHFGATGDGRGSSTGIAVAGSSVKDVILRDCEMFQCSWAFFAVGDAVTVDRVFCHDNYAYNTSPHPALVSVRRSFLTNSVFDAPGYHAFAGTMGIMLCNPQGLIIRNCTFRNQPDSGSHDEGGIDFENHGYGCLIDRCTFENNAGAAIEVLGLRSPQARGLEIQNSHFIRNNVARKLGPSEIYIWGKNPNPEVCCSTGVVHDNGYVLNDGVEFFVNEAPKSTVWSLRNNTQYASPEELRKAMPLNRPLVVKAGPDRHADSATVLLEGSVADDGLPGGSTVTTRWEVLEGPSPVTFADPGKPRTSAEFAEPGTYLLRLAADDGELWTSDMVAVHIHEPGTIVTRAWEFNTPLDKEGWTEVNPGTKVEDYTEQKWACKALPVKYVSGGYFILAIADSPDAHLLSPADLNIDLTANGVVHLRLQNHTPAPEMRLCFTTDTDGTWDLTKSKTFPVVTNDTGVRDYEVNLRDVPGWRGQLRQLRLDLATGQPLTGTCRIDAIWIGN